MIDKNNSSKIYLLKLLYRNLTNRRKKQLCLFLVVTLLCGIAEIYSIFSIIPFLNFFSKESNTENLSFIEPVLNIFLPIQSKNPFLFATFLFIFFISIANLLRILNLYFSSFLAAAIGSEFSDKAYRLTLNQPYIKHIQRNSSEVISSIVTQTDVTVSVINTILTLTTSIVVGLGIIYSLFMINWIITISISFIFVFLYLMLGTFFKKRLKKVSKAKAILVREQTKSLQEGLGSIREVILDNSQNFYSKLFKSNDRPIRFLNAKSEFIGSSPRYIFEVISLILIFLITYFYKLSIDNEFNILPLIGTFILGMQRLLPSFQSVYNSWVAITVNTNSALGFLYLLNQKAYKINTNKNKLNFEKNIKLKNINFSYDGKSPYVVNDFSLEISKGERVGIIGKSGSGKSTIADLIMGLLIPTSGEIQIDGINLHSNNIYHKEDWYGNISHVPQDIYLLDSSIAENIAFGKKHIDIDNKKLMEAINKAELSSLIKNPRDAFSIKVGERGIKLSGGQKQRIGIARAIYKGGGLLILDEATSALDSKTEESIMKTINNLDSSITIIVITHKLKNLSSCNKKIKII